MNNYKLISSSASEKIYEVSIKGDLFKIVVDNSGNILSFNRKAVSEIAQSSIKNIEFG